MHACVHEDWLSPLKYLDFLREYGPAFTINRMMSYESVKVRLEREQPLTFLEFNYMIFQVRVSCVLARSNSWDAEKTALRYMHMCRDGEMEALLVCWLLVGLFVRGFAASLAAFQLKTFLFPCLPHVSLSLSVSLSV